MQNGSIEFLNVGKKYRKGKRLLKEALLDIWKPNATEEFWALKDINFRVEPGETLGIIGPNGSGKSTLLKLLAGVAEPTQGSVCVSGRIAPLIELGAGFHSELTGRENIYINGTILGLSKQEIDDRVETIVQFAELEDFIDTPIKHYSSGMYMRLGFSVAVHVDPQILLVDEILAVGDSHFQEKSMLKMREFKEKGVTIVLVSHALESVRQFCDQVVYISYGKQVFSGATEAGITQYLTDVNQAA